MKTLALSLVAIVALAGLARAAAEPEWSMNATAIEACSCPMFCQCYFNVQPAGHSSMSHGSMSGMSGEDHFCKFNNAYLVNKGKYGSTSLDGAKFWIYGDLGGDFSKGEMNWAIVHFDPAVTKAQRDGILVAVGNLYPVKWQSLQIGKDMPIEWNGGKDRSVAKLDGGKAGEVVLVRNQGMSDEPIVIKNLRYWGAPRNDGFVLMPNEVEALRVVPEGKEPFEFKGTNGFMITFQIDANTAPPAAGT